MPSLADHAAIIFLSDFDNTMVEGNVTDTVFDRWGAKDWRGRMKRYQDGVESAESVNRGLFAEMTVPLAEIGAYAAAKTRMRPGVADVVAWCAAEGVSFVVNSAGADAYIRPILEAHHLGHLPVQSGVLTEEGASLRLRYLDPRGVELSGDFKAVWAEAARKRHNYVFYAGDGVSDKPASLHADFVFARDKLLAFARERHLAHASFTDFRDVLSVLKHQGMPAAARP